MSNKFNKFLVLGALTLGLTANASASPEQLKSDVAQSLKNKITLEIHDGIDFQIKQGFMKEKAKIDVHVASLHVDGHEHEQGSSLTHDHGHNHQNLAGRVNGECVVTLAFDDKGNIPALTSVDEIVKVTKLQNEKQQSLAREFVSLHENYHCEFSGIENPVLTNDKNVVYNQKINYILKDQISNPAFMKVAYIEVLNENFADTAAAMALIKRYGTSDPDLNYVLNSIKTQRHATYLNDIAQNHFTHFSLEEVVKSENLAKLKNINDGESFNKLALEIANKGTNKFVVNRPNLSQISLSPEHFLFSVTIHVSRAIRYHYLSQEEKNETMTKFWKDGISAGLSYEIADDLTKNAQSQYAHLKIFNPDGSMGEDKEQLQHAIHRILDTQVMSKEKGVVYHQVEPLLAKFQQNINQNTLPSRFDYKDGNVSIGSLDSKIKELRDKFTQNIKVNNLKNNSIN